jgi:tol-pal system protein YbgF
MSITASGCATTQDLDRVERRVARTSAEIEGLRGGQSDIVALLNEDAKASRQTLDKLDKLSSDMDSMKQDVELVKRNQANIGSSISNMAGGELMSYGGQIDELRHEVEATKLKLDAFKASLLQKLADIEAAIGDLGQAGGVTQPDALEGKSITRGSPESTGGNEGSAVPPVGDPLQLYQSAYLDYTKGNYELAMMGFKDYLSSFPDGEFAGNSQYWIGESLYSLGHYNEALIEFDRVLEKYPQSPKAPGALLKEGLSFEALGKGDSAKSAYTELVNKYPSSDAAKLAAEKMNPKKRGQVPGR